MNLQIGTTIKNLRTQRKVTQDQLATFLGVTPQAVSRWESDTAYPDIELLPSISEYFSISTDDLLGINLTEKEKRRNEIYNEMERVSEIGAGKDDVAQARQFVAEFPSDEKIQMNLANVLCQAYMWDEKPELNVLKEAEKLYQTLIASTENNEFRYEVIESLAALYAIGYKDSFKVEQVINQLPTMAYCREQVGSTVLSTMMDVQTGRTQDYIEKLTDSLGTTLQGYIVDKIPNDPAMWDTKISMFEWIISMYKFVFGEDMLFYHSRVATLYRIIATYKVAQSKYDETLDCLENMCVHVQKSIEAKPGDKYTSHFMNLMDYPEPVINGGKFHALVVHNDAWYILNQKLNQDRYNPIREMPRFKVVEEKLKKIAY